MRHSKARHRLNRFTSWREATLRSLTRNVLIHQSIHTTLHRAKAVEGMVEELISLAKQNTLSAKRKAYEVLGSHPLVAALFREIGPRFSNRTGGYTRIISLGKRRGDSAEAVIFELSEIVKKEKKPAKKAKAEKSEKPEPLTPGPEEKGKEKPVIEKKLEKEKAPEKPPITKKPTKKFLGGIRSIFKKERDSL